MAEQLVNFTEESSAKIPALTLLSNLGYIFIPPSDCEQFRGKLNVDNKTTSQVMLLPVMRTFLAKQTFPFAGKQHPLSATSIDKIMHELNPAMNEGLESANEKLYNAMMYGVGVTEFVGGKKHLRPFS
ncbi:type I restriction endonuclease [Piscirickettsia salmonis]|uniref:type I restriction endonuclease n=1 Tax=Piscirickettsia salmonis TaxID=1238 RepID=UPI000AF42533|nr:hypothetical protein [Piscirickettsia salmonis]